MNFFRFSSTFASLILMSQTALAMNLHDFLKSQSSLRASVKLAYLQELETFQEDPAYCSKQDSYPGMFDSCRSAVKEERTLLIHPAWGREWLLTGSTWVPTFGEVLTFKKTNILKANAPMQCEASLSIPANKPRSKRFSFDIYCDH